jgi:Uma2 family endonuclease
MNAPLKLPGSNVMTTLTKPTIVTPEDLLQLPDSSSMELVDGRIVEKHVSIKSSATELKIAYILTGFVETQTIARVFPASLGYQCFPSAPDRIRKPDVTLILNDRLRSLPNPDAGYMPIVPDLAVEVVSTHDTVYEIEEKLREYQEAKFPLIWVANPEARNVTVYPINGKPFILTADDEIRAEELLPGFVCKVTELFPMKP